MICKKGSEVSAGASQTNFSKTSDGNAVYSDSVA